MSKKLTPAIRYFTVPEDVSLPGGGDQAFRTFFEELMVHRLPRTTSEDLAISSKLFDLASARAGDKLELTETQWLALCKALPQVNVEGGVTNRGFMVLISFWDAVLSAPTAQPKNWTKAS